MIALDTNVVSELMRAEPDGAVLAWLDALHATDLVTTVITALELWTGVERLPQGGRRSALGAAVQQVLEDDVEDRVLPLTSPAAQAVAGVRASRAGAGRPVTLSDAAIAAICLQHGATLATRNTRDFEGTGIELVDPWGARA